MTLVADELLGYVRTGGLGTATTHLAVALGRMGLRVEILYVGEPPAAMAPEWSRLYESARVRIRVLSRSGEAVEPAFFGRMRDVELALGADPPDVVITQDLAAPAYTALRMRHLGLGFQNTLFVVHCHGTRQWITDMARKVRVLPGALAVTGLERASIELADVVVSPNVYMVEWMRGQDWGLPERVLTVPYLTRSAATGEPPPLVSKRRDGRVERLVFFGRLEERKGLRPFVAGLNALDPELLRRLELEFVGRATPAWTPEHIGSLLSESARRALRSVSCQTELDQQEALARLDRPGTLVVVPSLEDNSPNAVYECLERGVPFLASNAGGIGELVAPEDRDRVLLEPTAEGVAATLERALTGGEALRPVRPAFEPAASLRAWDEVVALRPRARGRSDERPAVEVVVVQRGSREALARCLSALAAQSYRAFRVIVVRTGREVLEVAAVAGLELTVVPSASTSLEAMRQAGLEAGSSPFLCFLDEEDVPEPELLDTLVRAQAASGADVVSCGVYLEETEGRRTLRLFAGEPRGLGLIGNGYGQVALLRRSLLPELRNPWPVMGDPDWPLLSGLSLAGARIVSVPAPLLTRSKPLRALEHQPSDALLVVEQLERALPDQLQSLGRLAAGLAAASKPSPPVPSDGLARRTARALRKEGLTGLARQAGGRWLRRLPRSRS